MSQWTLLGQCVSVDLIGTVCLSGPYWDISMSQWTLLGQYVSVVHTETIVCLSGPH